MSKKTTTLLSRQFNTRVSDEMHGRVGEVADALGLDPSDLIRMILAEKLPEYEDRAEAVKRRRKESQSRRSEGHQETRKQE